MLMSRTISLPIARPSAEVYDFVLEPRNYPRWAAAVGGRFEHIEDCDWRAETPHGLLTIRFSEPNSFGIFDHAVFREGEEPLMRRARVVPNGEGCEMLYTMFKREDVSTAAFESEVEWTATELTVLKTYLELRNHNPDDFGPAPVPPG